MNILILNWRDPKNPYSGGAEISLMEHAKFWIKKGAKITWFASHYKNAPEEEIINGIKIIRKGSHYTVHIWSFIYYLQNKFTKPDLIIDCFHFIPFFTPLYYKKIKKIGLINEPAKNAWFKNIFFPLSLIGYLIEPLFFILYKNNLILTVSESIASELTNYKLDKKKIQIIPNGHTPLSAKIKLEKEKDPTVIYLGQITPDKGIEEAIKAFEKIVQKTPGAKLWIVGKAINDRYLAGIKKKISKRNLNKVITFFGFVNEQKKYELLSKSWMLIHPSIREGWGLNVIEANSCGTPAIGYKITGLKDSIIHKKTGLLVDRKPYSLADAVNKLINDKKQYDNMCIKAKKWADTFNWELSGEKSWNLIKTL